MQLGLNSIIIHIVVEIPYIYKVLPCLRCALRIVNLPHQMETVTRVAVDQSHNSSNVEQVYVLICARESSDYKCSNTGWVHNNRPSRILLCKYTEIYSVPKAKKQCNGLKYEHIK
ncbi:hypothetical protein ACHQM5_021833 [Ranunculus cassubicifolius]